MGDCVDVWWAGSRVEHTVKIYRHLGGDRDTSFEEQEVERFREYLQANCVGIGIRLATVWGTERCSEVSSAASFLSRRISSRREIGYPTFFFEFGKRELDGFLAAAGC